MKIIILVFFFLILNLSNVYSQKYNDLLNEVKIIDGTDIEKINRLLEKVIKVVEIETEYVQKCNNEMRLFSKSRTISCDELKRRIKDSYIDNLGLIMFNENLNKAVLDAAKRHDELNKKKSKEANAVEAKKLSYNVTLMVSRMKNFNHELEEFNLRRE